MSIALSAYRSPNRINLIEAGRINPSLPFARSTSATYLASNGLITTAAVNTPRFAYDGSGNYLGLLLENASTNRLLYSQALDNAAWVKSQSGLGTVPAATSNYGVAPDGTTTATRVTLNLNGGTTSSDFSQIQQTTTGLTVAQSYTTSIWLKSNSGSVAVTLVDCGGNTLLITVTPTWTRFSVTNTAIATSALSIRLRLLGSEATATSADLLMWGGQFENATTASSYIATTSASVTRSADVILLTDLSKIKFNATSGTFTANVVWGLWNATQQSVFTLMNTDLTNRIQMRRETSTTVSTGLVIASNVFQFSSPRSSTADNTTCKISFTYKASNFGGSINAGTAVIGATGTVPSLTKMYIGQAFGGNYLFGYIKSLSYYPALNETANLARLST
jgi:hypothetical protein